MQQILHCWRFLDLQHARIVRLYVLVVDCSFGYQYLTFKKLVGQLFETEKQMRKRTIEGFVRKCQLALTVFTANFDSKAINIIYTDKKLYNYEQHINCGH